jgi:LPXTG-motif cell wall-anchored protein
MGFNRGRGRRVLVGAAGLLIAATGALATSAPAHAVAAGEPTVEFESNCHGTIFHVSGSGIDWTLLVDGEVDRVRTDFTGGVTDIVFRFEGTALELQVQESDGDGEWTFSHEWVAPDGCEPTDVPGADLMVAANCDIVVFILRNTMDEDGHLELHLTPHQDAVHGHAPGLVGLLDEGHGTGTVPAPGDSTLDIVGDIAGGATVELGPLEFGDAHAHGFEAFEGLTVTVEVIFDDPHATEVSLMYQHTFSWDEVIADLGLECASSGKLADTGAPTALFAAGALLLLAAGGGLFWAARRRRVTFVS